MWMLAPAGTDQHDFTIKTLSGLYLGIKGSAKDYSLITAPEGHDETIWTWEMTTSSKSVSIYSKVTKQPLLLNNDFFADGSSDHPTYDPYFYLPYNHPNCKVDISYVEGSAKYPEEDSLYHFQRMRFVNPSNEVKSQYIFG